MGKSRINSKYMEGLIEKESNRKYSGLKKTSNSHKFDEMPKNKPSKYVSTRCGNVDWLQEPSNYSGHRPVRGGHRMVSGIVRAKVKQEYKKDMLDEAVGVIEDMNDPFSFEKYCGSCDFFKTEHCPHSSKVDSETEWKLIPCDKFYD